VVAQKNVRNREISVSQNGDISWKKQMEMSAAAADLVTLLDQDRGEN